MWNWPVPVTELEALVRSRLDLLDDATTPVLVHFDLWDGNILVDSPKGRAEVTGLIDGERAFWVIPSRSSCPWRYLGDIEQDPAFLAGYREIAVHLEFDDRVRARLSLYRCYLYLIMLVGSHRDGSPACRAALAAGRGRALPDHRARRVARIPKQTDREQQMWVPRVERGVMDPGDSSRATEKTVAPVQASSSVPESKRFCRNCGAKVGRGHGGAPGAVSGFCSNCGAPFSFEPKLRVENGPAARRYEVVGSSTGATYLARDREIDRTVVLKEVADAATTRDILTGVEHPNIVEVYDVVDPGYSVTEYVGGATLRELAGRPPLPRVITYGLEILLPPWVTCTTGACSTPISTSTTFSWCTTTRSWSTWTRCGCDHPESPLWSSCSSAPQLTQ